MGYDARWLAATGLPLDVLVDGSVVTQHLARARYRLRLLTVLPGSPPRRVARRARATARHARWLATSRYTEWARRRATSGRETGAR
jgi:Ser/Thr protein kinase RdoA (MazF antagonist)